MTESAQMRSGFVIAAFWGAVVCGATEIALEKQLPNLGQAVYPLSEQAWRSQIMTWPGKTDAVERVQCGPEFFEKEYGKPCVFSSDFIKEYGHSEGGAYKLEENALTFTAGPKGFTFGFGPYAGDKNRPSVRFGSGWPSCPLRLTIELEQDKAETEWSFQSTSYGYAHFTIDKSFKVAGTNRQCIDIEVYNGNFWWIPDGFQIRCQTPGANVKLWKMQIYPTSADVCFRKEFTLSEKPILAHASFLPCADYDLAVNGKMVDSGDERPSLLQTVDLVPYLTQGNNHIEFRKRFVTWSKSDPSLLFEAVAVDRSGHVSRIVGDASWKVGTKPGEWLAPRLSTYSTTMADGTQVSTGIEPKHMGMLDAVPSGRQYPVFEDDETVRFFCRLPAGVKGKLRPRLEIFRAGSDEKVESLDAPAPRDDGDFTAYDFLPNVRVPGPYRLQWSLRDKDGKTIETRRGELVVIGSVPQDKLPLTTFEMELAKRLKPVVKIDCTTPPAADEFLDHAGMYNAPMTDKGKVVTADGMTYRETGSGKCDYFAYRIRGLERGEPYIVEVIVPDNRDRMILSGVVETFPIGMGWNYSNGSRGWFSTTGSCLTGRGNYPFSKGKLALRYVYHPNSMAAAVVVMTGLLGAPAAACEINVYKVEGGLPALELPPTERTFGQHNERLSTMAITMVSDNPLEVTSSYYWTSGHRDGWANWYRALERKVRWLRYQGENMSVEGIYMYKRGDYPSEKENPIGSDGGLDIPEMMLRMYSRNGIHCFLGIEYFMSYSLKKRDILSDRRVREEGGRGIRAVNEEGRQQRGVNFLDPDAEQSILDCLGEIYDRYKHVGTPDGVFVVCGGSWIPALSDKVGYDDFTCSLFEKETGVSLGVAPTDTERFQKHCDLLTGEHQALWREWRALKVRAFLDKLTKRMGGWDMVIAPQWYRKAGAFEDAESTRRQRNQAMDEALRSLGLPLDLYPPGQPGPRLIAPMQEVDWCYGKDSLEDDMLPYHGWNTCPGSRIIMKQLDAMYLSSCLYEIDCPAKAAERWLWSHTTRAAFDVRGAGENCMHHIVDAIRDHSPQDLFVAWLDCNLVTGHGEQERRFAKAFFATPDVEFQSLPEASVRGITAQTATLTDGSTCLRLVNDSHYPVSGCFTAKAEAVRDMVFDADLKHGFINHDYRVTMRPNDIRVYTLSSLEGGVMCDFDFPEDVVAGIARQVDYLLANRQFLERVPGDLIARLFAARAAGDTYALHAVLDDFEMAGKVKLAKRELEALDWQAKLLEDLDKTGSARIDCGSPSPYVDPKGRRWLPDQQWLDCGAYGSIDASFVDRGGMAIKSTDCPRPYQTEAYGSQVLYRIPLPNGDYNVILHVAETFERNKRAGLRLFSVKVNTHLWEKRVDPFAEAGGFATAVTLADRKIHVADGQLVVELTGGVGVQGLEVEKSK